MLRKISHKLPIETLKSKQIPRVKNAMPVFCNLPSNGELAT